MIRFVLDPAFLSIGQVIYGWITAIQPATRQTIMRNLLPWFGVVILVLLGATSVIYGIKSISKINVGRQSQAPAKATSIHVQVPSAGESSQNRVYLPAIYKSAAAAQGARLVKKALTMGRSTGVSHAGYQAFARNHLKT